MTETTKITYCDMLKEHGNAKVTENVHTYKDIPVMFFDAAGNKYITKGTLDMCDDCYKKYNINLRMIYNAAGILGYQFAVPDATDLSDDTTF